METAVLTKSGYTKLLSDLKQIIEEGKKRAKQAAQQELIQTYWQIGKRIKEEQITQNAGYYYSIIGDLSEDLGIDTSTLKRCVIFFGQYEIGAPRGTKLTWAHYRELLPLPNDKERKWYELEVGKQGWKRDDLKSAVKRDAFGEAKGGKLRTKKKGPKRPQEPTYVYKAEVLRVIDGDTLLLRIDLGFQVWKEQRVRSLT